MLMPTEEERITNGGPGLAHHSWNVTWIVSIARVINIGNKDVTTIVMVAVCILIDRADCCFNSGTKQIRRDRRPILERSALGRLQQPISPLFEDRERRIWKISELLPR